MSISLTTKSCLLLPTAPSKKLSHLQMLELVGYHFLIKIRSRYCLVAKMMKPCQTYPSLIATEIHKRVSFAVPARANKQNCYSVRTSKIDTKKLIWHNTSLSLHFNGHLPGEPGLAGVH